MMRSSRDAVLVLAGEAEEDGYDDEYALEDLEVAASDYIKPTLLGNFRAAWEGLPQEAEVRCRPPRCTCTFPPMPPRYCDVPQPRWLRRGSVPKSRKSCHSPLSQHLLAAANAATMRCCSTT